MVLTKEIAYKEIRSFFSNNPAPLIVFGSGLSCSVDIGFGMNRLKDELLVEIPKKISGDKSLESEWEKVLNDLTSGKDLESSMNNINNDSLIGYIVKITGNLVASLDKYYAQRLLNKDICWSALDFFKCMVNGLPEGDRALHVVTPNYDILAEYAFESIGLLYVNGFIGNFVRHLDWERCNKLILYSEKVYRGTRLKKVNKNYKHIKLYKVHGSLNTFLINNEVIENNSWIWFPPNEIERVIITPGILKFERITAFREELLRQFDEAVKKKDSFVFLGYGFNDRHLENYIIPKLNEQKCHGLIITRDNNDRIESLCSQADNLWLICKQEHNEFTRIKNKQYKDWFLLPDLKLWDLQQFTKEIIIGG